TVAPSPLRCPPPAETARHGRPSPLRGSAPAETARHGRPSPLRWPAPAETARHGRSKSTPVARSGGGRSPRSPEAGSGEIVLAPWAVQGPCSRLVWFRTLSLHLRRPAE